MEKEKKEKTPRALGKGAAGKGGGENLTNRTPNLERGGMSEGRGDSSGVPVREGIS